MKDSGRRRFLRFSKPRRSTIHIILDYRAPEGFQTIDNSEEFERIRRCMDEGKDPFEGMYAYAGYGMRRKHRSKPPIILDYRAPEGSQTIDNSEEFERIRRCMEEGRDPFEGMYAYTGYGMRRKHRSKPIPPIGRTESRSTHDSEQSAGNRSGPGPGDDGHKGDGAVTRRKGRTDDGQTDQSAGDAED